MDDRILALEKELNELTDLGLALSLLNWDRDVMMPPGGSEARAWQLATLRRLQHERLISDSMGALIAVAESAAAEDDPDGYAARLVRVARRDYDKARRVPAALESELAHTRGLAQPAWARARQEGDYALFQPWLAKMLDLTRRRAEHLNGGGDLYDPLLDQFEPGMRTAEVVPLFAELRDGLVPVVRAIADHAEAVDASILAGHYPVDAQEAACRDVAAVLGFDFERGRLDTAVHPFAMGLSRCDVRITTRYDEGDVTKALFGTMHEVGHGLYEQGFDSRYQRTPLADAASLGFHESQSRLWENQLGRGEAFWAFYYPRLQARFAAALGDVSRDAFYRAVNRVQPSMIRVDADEVTYNLHIMLRFEIERRLLAGDIPLDELPDVWGDLMEAYLGIRPRHVAEGVLQDVHWSIGLIGYFPTYTLGNLISAQLYERFLADVPDFPARAASGDFSALLTWMRRHVHAPGAAFTPAELIHRLTGGPIEVGPYMRYIREKYGPLYALA